MKIEVATDRPTVHKLLDAAIPLFATKGVAAVSVKELADAAGVNVALISYYFGGKENLYAFILERQLALLGNTLDEIEHKESCPVAKIRRFAETVATVHKENPYMDRLFFSELANPTKYFDSLVIKAATKLHYFLINCISDAMAKGMFRADLRPEYAAIALIKILNLSFITKLLFKESLSSNQDTIEGYSSQAFDIYLRGVSV